MLITYTVYKYNLHNGFFLVSTVYELWIRQDMRFNYTGTNNFTHIVWWNSRAHTYIYVHIYASVCGGTHATSSPKSLIFLWQVSSRERREEEALLELPVPVPAPPWCTGVGGAETVVVEDATAAAADATAADAEADEGSRGPRTVTAPRAGDRSIVVVVIVVVEDDLLGAPPSCPRIRSRTLGRHQILFNCHRTLASTCRDFAFVPVPLEGAREAARVTAPPSGSSRYRGRNVPNVPRCSEVEDGREVFFGLWFAWIRLFEN